MKRALLLLAFLVTGATTLSAQTVTARVGGELTGFPGQQLVVPIVVDMTAAGGAGLGSYTARLQWDTAVLSGPGAFPGNFPAPQLNNDSGFAGILKFGGIAPLGVSGLVTVAQVYFNIDSAASTPITLSFSEMSAAGTFTDLMPELAGRVISGTFCPAKGRWGDLDRDGASNSRDALAILSQLVGISVDTTFHMDLGDVDGDNLVNSRDALVVLSYAVGLSIAGERVLLPAPSGCGTGAATSISVFPATAQLVPSQGVRLLAQGIDAAGNGVTIPPASWRSSDEAVAGVDPSGIVTAREAGTATITAVVAPGLKSQATITVIPRRANWYVDLKAIGSPVQLGTAAAPFERPNAAYQLALDGDTIRIASGTYLISEDGDLSHGVVVLGGTPGDTTTRPVLRAEIGNYTAFRLNGGMRTVIRNVVLEDFDFGVELDGVRSFALEDSRIAVPRNSAGNAIYDDCAVPMDTLRIEGSELTGHPIAEIGGYGVYWQGCYPLAILLARNSRITQWHGDGIRLADADSVAVVGSNVSDNNGFGIGVTQSVAIQPSVYLAHDTVERNGSTGIYVDQGRRLVMDTTLVRSAQNSDAIDFNGVGGGLGAPRFSGVSRAPALAGSSQVYLHASQIYVDADAVDNNWMRANNFDSLVIEHSLVQFPDSTNYAYAYGDFSGNIAIVDSTRFQNMGNGASPASFHVAEFSSDSVEFNGCSKPGCDGGSGFEIYSNSNLLNASVRHARFKTIGYPIYISSSQGVHQVTDVVIDSAGDGIAVGGDSFYVARNTMTKIWGSGISASGGVPTNRVSVIAGNDVTCSASFTSGVALNYQRPFQVSADTIATCSKGVVANGVASGSIIVGGTLRNNPTGIEILQYDTASVLVDFTGISGSTNAILVTQGHVIVTRNRIEANGFGVYVQSAGGTVPQVHQNSFVGNTSEALYVVSDTVDATANWWGANAPPCAPTGPNCVFGRVDTTGYLPAEPLGLPGLAPPRYLAIAPTSASQLRTAQPTSVVTSKRLDPAARQAAAARRIQIHEERRARRDREDAARAAREAAIRAAHQVRSRRSITRR